MEVMKIQGPPSKDPMHVLLQLLPATLQQATHRPTPPLETPGHFQASLGQSLMGSLLLFLGPGAHKVMCVLQESISQSCVSSGSSVVGLMATSSMRASAIPRSAAARALVPVHTYLPVHTSTGDAQTQFCLSVCGVPGSWSTQGFV